MIKKFFYRKGYLFFQHFWNVSLNANQVMVFSIWSYTNESSFWKTMCAIVVLVSFVLLCLAIFGLVAHLKRAKKYGDIRIEEDSFFYWDGWFEHQFKWMYVSKVRFTSGETNILKVFFKFNVKEHLDGSAEDSKLKNYYRRRLIRKNIPIHLNRYQDKENLELNLRAPVKISSPKF